MSLPSRRHCAAHSDMHAICRRMYALNMSELRPHRSLSIHMHGIMISSLSGEHVDLSMMLTCLRLVGFTETSHLHYLNSCLDALICCSQRMAAVCIDCMQIDETMESLANERLARLSEKATLCHWEVLAEVLGLCSQTTDSHMHDHDSQLYRQLPATLKAGPLEAILVIFGRRALIFFKALGKNEKWHHFCAHAQWWSPCRRKNVEKGHLAPSNLTFLSIVKDTNGFHRMKEEGLIDKICLRFFNFCLGT